MSIIIASHFTIHSPYPSGVFSKDKIFVCEKCQSVVVDPVKNLGWGSCNKYDCLSSGGCGSQITLVQLKDYHGPKLEKHHYAFSTTNNWICHPDLFSVDEKENVYLETDLTIVNRKTLTTFINETLDQHSKMDDDSLVKELQKKNPEELSLILGRLFSRK